MAGQVVMARRKLGPYGSLRRSLTDVAKDAKHLIEALERKDVHEFESELGTLKSDVALIEAQFTEWKSAD